MRIDLKEGLMFLKVLHDRDHFAAFVAEGMKRAQLMLVPRDPGIACSPARSALQRDRLGRSFCF
jgi:hypothetical protein